MNSHALLFCPRFLKSNQVSCHPKVKIVKIMFFPQNELETVIMDVPKVGSQGSQRECVSLISVFI